MFSFAPIGYVNSPYREKFAIPRQPGLAPSAQGRIVLTNAANSQDCVQGLNEFSHIWVQFVFHATADKGWKAKVRPPRLGGNQRVGVFATRSTFRPNPIGLSVIKLEGIVHENDHWQLRISGFDLLHETPVLDIKPYVRYSDSVSDASSGFATEAPASVMPVSFTPQALAFLHKLPSQLLLKPLIEEILAQDPRPAYRAKKEDANNYGMRLYDFNIRWHVNANEAVVTEVRDC